MPLVITFRTFATVLANKSYNIMQTKIIQIGNSKGLIIPSGILSAAGLSTKTPVDIFLSQGSIVIKPQVRQGWADAAKKAHEESGDKLLAPDILNDDITDEIVW